MAEPYVRMTYEEYKALEKACREFKETTHTSVEGFYHKSFRLPVGPLIFEFVGPLVPAGYHLVEE